MAGAARIGFVRSKLILGAGIRDGLPDNANEHSPVVPQGHKTVDVDYRIGELLLGDGGGRAIEFSHHRP